MATKKKIAFNSIVYDPKFNHRSLDRQLVDDLKKSIMVDGLLSSIECTPYIDVGEEGESVQKHKLVDGAHRHLALCELRDSTDPAEIATFEKVVPNGKFEVDLTEGDYEKLRERSVKHNTYRKELEPHEVYSEVLRLAGIGRDQYETAEILRIQQPRVAELLSFQAVSLEGHDLWRRGVLSNADMVKLASLSPEDQDTALKAFEGVAGAPATKEAKASKAKARKALKATASEKGSKRAYANAGKPTRKKLASYVPQIAVRAQHAKTADERAFFNALAAAFKVVNGELDFEKISFDKTYVTKKDADEAQKLLDAAAAKAAAKAEKVKAKKPKKEKAAKAEKPAKAPKKAAKKAPKAPKKASKKAPKKAKKSK